MGWGARGSFLRTLERVPAKRDAAHAIARAGGAEAQTQRESASRGPSIRGLVLGNRGRRSAGAGLYDPRYATVLVALPNGSLRRSQTTYYTSLAAFRSSSC